MRTRRFAGVFAAMLLVVLGGLLLGAAGMAFTAQTLPAMLEQISVHTQGLPVPPLHFDLAWREHPHLHHFGADAWRYLNQAGWLTLGGGLLLLMLMVARTRPAKPAPAGSAVDQMLPGLEGRAELLRLRVEKLESRLWERRTGARR